MCVWYEPVVAMCWSAYRVGRLLYCKGKVYVLDRYIQLCYDMASVGYGRGAAMHGSLYYVGWHMEGMVCSMVGCVHGRREVLPAPLLGRVPPLLENHLRLPKLPPPPW